MTVARPAGRPRLTRDQVLARIMSEGIDPAQHPLMIVGIRAYYRDTLGAPGRNDRGIYDDALIIVGPGFFRTFNGNTDPSRYRKGSGFGAGKGMACLKPGFWPSYQFGLHKGYEALIQTGGKVTVWRDGAPDYVETGHFGINIHRGGVTTTGSEGCQTIPPDQWQEFIDAAQQLGKSIHGSAWRKAVVPYLLLEEPAR